MQVFVMDHLETAQIFHRMYLETKENIFKQASDMWIEDGLSKGIHENGLAGYKQWDNIKNEWIAKATLLEGIAGIGLTIIDQLADFETTWDECLMIS